jgi:hypothetical protein
MLVVIYRSNNNASDLAFLSITSISRTCAAALRCCCLTSMHQIAKIADISWENHQRRGIQVFWDLVELLTDHTWEAMSVSAGFSIVRCQNLGLWVLDEALMVSRWLFSYGGEAFLLLLLLQQSALECVALPIICGTASFASAFKCNLSDS